MAAHPSPVASTQYQAEDVIFDLANNVILKLTQGLTVPLDYSQVPLGG